MPLLDKAAKGLADRLPSVISPRTHAIIDYTTAAAFLTIGGVLWRKNPRAAVASLICGSAELFTSLLTDYEGTSRRPVSFQQHGRIDAGLIGITGGMPSFLGFSETSQARLFRMQAVGKALVAGLTDFTGTGERKQLKQLEKRLA